MRSSKGLSTVDPASQSQTGPAKSSAFSDRSFRRLWAATLSAQGASAIASVLIPLLAIQVLGVGSSGVTVMSTAAACTAVVVALPAGMFSEFRRKRPILIGSDAVRFLSFTLLTIAALFGFLSLPWLIAILCVNAIMQMLFGSASLAHTKDLVPEELRADAVSKLQSAAWIAMIGGPVAAGLLASLISPTIVLACVAFCFLGSAIWIALIPTPEGAPPAQIGERHPIRDTFAGVTYFAQDPILRRLLLSWVLFAGAVAALTPVTQVFFLHDLEFSTASYGIAMGVPSVAALAGSWLGGPILKKLGLRRAMTIGSFSRIPLYLIYPVLPPGQLGLIGAIAAFAGILFISSIVNAAISTLRMELTPDSLLSRTSSAWMVATMAAGPLLIPLAGFIMTSGTPRLALLCLAVTVAISAAVLPGRTLHSSAPGLVDGPR